ncbi:hypothetical protein [Mycobacterium sp. HUMS_1102779]
MRTGWRPVKPQQRASFHRRHVGVGGTSPDDGVLPRTRVLLPRHRLFTEAVAVVYIVVAAQCDGRHYLFFPGLAALAYDVLTRPWGKWASQPARLVLTPSVAAVAGVWTTRQFPYHFLTVVGLVTGCLLVVAALKSNIAPAIAAGVLPLVLGIESWVYPASIAVSLVVLLCILLPWQRYCRRRYQSADATAATNLDDILETPPGGRGWIVPFYAFVTTMALCAAASGLRLLLIPPVIVIAYAMFAHPGTCPWAGKPIALLAACSSISTAGWIAVSLWGKGGFAAGCAMVLGIIVLRALKFHMPPALAIGLLPLVIVSPGIEFPVSVTVGAAALTLAYLIYRRLNMRSAQCQTPN